MTKLHNTALKRLAVSASFIAVAAATPAFAQTSPESDVECVDGVDSNADGVIDTCPGTEQISVADQGSSAPSGNSQIVVTGSRIVRDTYSSLSPLQVITNDRQQDVGAFDPSQILQRDEAAAGTQIDATFQGFVLDNGPGSQTVNLRGLGDNRTLLLLNGRRLSPAGVGGSPTAPSINLLPSSLIDRVDLLLDGASSIYGSDAVAGVANVILKQDFDGLELYASGEINPQGAGDDYLVSAAYGFNTDRGFVGLGVEYAHRDRIRASDRDFLAGCDTHYEITQDGEIRTLGLLDQNEALLNSGGTISGRADVCKRRGYGLSGSFIEPFGAFGVLYNTPGQTNVQTPEYPDGVPNFTESTDFFGNPLDTDGDGFQDIIFADYSSNGAFPQLEIIPEQKRYNVMAYGEYALPGDANITPFFEFLYSRADIKSRDSFLSQVTVNVPDNNQFNPCNPFQPNGVDCYDASLVFNGLDQFRLPFAVPESVTARVNVAGDRNQFDVSVEQYRGVLGVRGDLPFIDPSWRFEVSGLYTRSIGKLTARGIREDKLAFALGIDPTADFTFDGVVDNDGDGIADDYDSTLEFGFFGDADPIIACDATMLANPQLAAPDLTEGCVPVNLFADSLLGSSNGDFATAAERDYVFGSRDFDTTYEQIVIGGFISGDLVSVPAGNIGAVFGVEWREDKIDSRPNFTAANGLILDFFSDRGATGSKWIREAYAEIDIPVLADVPGTRELNINLSGRVTDEELYGTAGTYSAKLGWRPVDPLLLRFSYGTSFRAPNLRENFLIGTTGFQNIVDPCAVPTDAFVGGGYDASRDTRDRAVLENCIREGRDPTSVGIITSPTAPPRLIRTSGVEIARVGSLDLDPETSRSVTAGFSFEETFGDGWDVSLSGTYYDIEISQSVVELSAQFAVSDCFGRDDGVRSQFCDALSISGAAGNPGLITAADIGFLNLDTDKVEGLDFNADFGKEFPMFGRFVDFGLEFRANHLLERSRIFVDVTGNETFARFEGQFGLPRWTGRGTFTAEVDKFLFTWQTRYVGPQNRNSAGRDPFADNFGNGPNGETGLEPGDTCTGNGSGGANPIIPGDGAFCRDVGSTGNYFEHAASIRYRDDLWEFRVGVTNIFDNDPPNIDCDESVLCVSNVPIGNGYDLDGREFFATVRREF